MINKYGKSVFISEPVVEPPTIEEELAVLKDRVAALEAL